MYFLKGLSIQSFRNYKELAPQRLFFTHFDFLCLKFRGFLTAADAGLSSLSESEVKLVTAEEFLVLSAFSAILYFRIKLSFRYCVVERRVLIKGNE